LSTVNLDGLSQFYTLCKIDTGAAVAAWVVGVAVTVGGLALAIIAGIAFHWIFCFLAVPPILAVAVIVGFSTYGLSFFAARGIAHRILGPSHSPYKALTEWVSSSKKPSLSLCFAETKGGGSKKLVLLQKGKGYEGYKVSPCKASSLRDVPDELLLSLIQLEQLSIQKVLDPSYSGDLFHDFWSHFIICGANEKILLQAASAPLLLKILEFAQTNNIAIGVDAVKVLFSQWAERGEARITQALLTINSSVMNDWKALFRQAVLCERRKEANLLWDTAREQGLKPDADMVRIYQVFKGEYQLSPETFFALSNEQQRSLFQIANICRRETLLAGLRGLGAGPRPVSPPKGPALFNFSTTFIEAEKILQEFLVDLRKGRRLLTTSEVARQRGLAYYYYLQIDSILAGDHIERMAQASGFPEIKVPRKAAVLRPNAQENEENSALQFQVPSDSSMSINCSALLIYSEYIQDTNRKLEQYDMLRLLNFIDTVGCYYPRVRSGKNKSNEEGIYFFAQHSDFYANPDQQRMFKLLKNLMKEEDHLWLSDEIGRRFFSDQAIAERSRRLEERCSAQKEASPWYDFAKEVHNMPLRVAIKDVFLPLKMERNTPSPLQCFDRGALTRPNQESCKNLKLHLANSG
jgi:hypothetical protein